ncbi:EmrB/QacA subfamily drug resistance transporter [Listeria weihenstephanensis FSL R9-0317]|uniref:Multidrug MFS transporter n=1 Tax=Listeria weihenstephanensis TaxID=1006155 RepID=A0A1S7FSA0_9LIST|nr:MFS transporter [Listeria weihenstephanensis]AQY50215.1 multidrug MFS transporter [Listeria weihenstephanensis]EUJ39379.1 EmrB/QacA subfamily drug resistance transporter [Listeria weihenstephanensis FSL R9-0317]
MKESKKWWVLGTVSLAVFMAMLDITIVNVALPEIQQSFAGSFSSLQWVLNAYTLVYAVMLLPVSKLGDRFSRKIVFLSGLLVFIIGSLASGMATSDLWLNIFRGLQGVGGAAMMSLSLSIVTSAFPEKQRGLALGIWSSAVGLAVSIGPLLGGILVDSLGWRSIFLINIPVGIIAILFGMIFITDTTKKQRESFDFLGLIFSTIMIFSAVFALIQKQTHSDYTWTNWRIIALFALAVVSLGLFIIAERKVKVPMIDLSIFKSRSFIGANIAAFTLGAGLYGGFTYLSILMQNYMGYSAFETGLKLLLISVFTLILGPFTWVITNRIGNRWLITIALFIGMVGILIINYLLKVPFEWSYLFPGFILLGISNALVNPPISNVAMSSVAEKHIGMASGILNVSRQVGISFGVVMLGISVTNGYFDSLTSSLKNMTEVPAAMKTQLVEILHKAGPFAGQQIFDSKQAEAYQQLPIFDQIKNIVFQAFNEGMNHANILIAVLLGIGALASLLLIRDKQKA